MIRSCQLCCGQQRRHVCSPMTAGNEVRLVPKADVEPSLVVGKNEGRPRAHLISSLSSGGVLKWEVPQIIQVIRSVLKPMVTWGSQVSGNHLISAPVATKPYESHKEKLVAVKILQSLRRKRAKCRRYGTCTAGMPTP